MARVARVVAPGLPHHVTQRGNRRGQIFMEAGDQQLYLNLLGQQLQRRGVACWSWCLMPNHVHLILVPRDEAGLGLAIGEAHRRYTTFINLRCGWSGHLFQNRFASVAMDEAHLQAAFRYVALNPVKAGLSRRPEDWPWASTRALMAAKGDRLLDVRPALDRVGDFAAFLSEAAAEDEARWAMVRGREATGRPAGGEDWVKALEARLGVPLTPQKRGPKPRPVSGVSGTAYQMRKFERADRQAISVIDILSPK